MIARRRFVGGLIGSLLLPAVRLHSAPKATTIAAARSQGLAWLLSQQAGSGGWHSRTYGNLREGIGLTSLVLKAIASTGSQVPDDAWQAALAAGRRGVNFLMRRQDSHGLVCGPNGETDQPIYATALLLEAAAIVPEWELSESLRAKLIAALWDAQFGPAAGCQPKDEEFGGWGPLPPERSARLPGDSANIAVTAHVLSVLRQYDALPEETNARARTFIDRCRGRDGFGFVPPADSPLNKAGMVESDGKPDVAAGYPSATCDGWLAMQATGLFASAELRQAFEQYLAMPLPSVAEDLPERASRARQQLAGLWFYHAARASEVAKRISLPKLSQKREQLRERLLSQQQDNGSWQNAIATMREDDPLVATSMAVIALQEMMPPEKVSP
ncbi:hypothetical protein AB1L30_19310 [Bremerella sp. JC817]|uniref:hypothetical protein n=1 Tax=Bremerella sp. JC817 TaxID=3231756 RepID=UPI0034595866